MLYKLRTNHSVSFENQKKKMIIHKIYFTKRPKIPHPNKYKKKDIIDWPDSYQNETNLLFLELTC